MKIKYERNKYNQLVTECPSKQGFGHGIAKVRSVFCELMCGHCKSDNGKEIECDFGEVNG